MPYVNAIGVWLYSRRETKWCARAYVGSQSRACLNKQGWKECRTEANVWLGEKKSHRLTTKYDQLVESDSWKSRGLDWPQNGRDKETREIFEHFQVWNSKEPKQARGKTGTKMFECHDVRMNCPSNRPRCVWLAHPRDWRHASKWFLPKVRMKLSNQVGQIGEYVKPDETP